MRFTELSFWLAGYTLWIWVVLRNTTENSCRPPTISFIVSELVPLIPAGRLCLWVIWFKIQLLLLYNNNPICTAVAVN